MKIIFYGVRDVEVPIFEAVNKKFGYEMTLIPEYLTDEATAKNAAGMMLSYCAETVLQQRSGWIFIRSSALNMC